MGVSSRRTIAFVEGVSALVPHAPTHVLGPLLGYTARSRMGAKVSGRLVAIESATEAIGFAFSEGTSLVHEASLSAGARSESLLSVLSAAMREISWEPGSVERWAVDVGPGSFTGIRVGVALAKSIAYACRAELAAVGSLDALLLAASSAEGAGLVGAILAPNRDVAFVKVVRRGHSRLEEPVLAAQSVAWGEAHEVLCRAFDGAGGVLVGRAAGELAGGPWRVLAGPPCDVPHARWVALLGREAQPEKDLLTEPAYLRPPNITAPRGG